MSGNQPNTSLYINNLNDKINKEELRAQLYALFTTYGKIIDVIATKSAKMRGQAFLVFTDLAGATSALRACEGMVFYDKPMVSCGSFISGLDADRLLQHIDYAKSKSWATLKREDPAFVAPNSAHATQAAQHAGRITISSDKRPRDEEMADGERQTKQQKADDDDDEEMEIDDEEEAGQPSAPFTSGTSAYLPNRHMLVLRHRAGSLCASHFPATHLAITMYKSAARGHRLRAHYIAGTVSTSYYVPCECLSHNPGAMASSRAKSSSRRLRMHKGCRSKWRKPCSNPWTLPPPQKRRWTDTR